MACCAYIGKIRKGRENEYTEAHKAVWPELLAVMRKAGVEKQICFVRENYIFVYIEADDIEMTMRALSDDPVNCQWDAYMEPFLEVPIEGCPDLFCVMKNVFQM